jgi:hypothetical protein
MLVRMWRNWNLELLVGMKKDVTMLENCLVTTHKVKYKFIIILSSNSISRYILKIIENMTHTHWNSIYPQKQKERKSDTLYKDEP